MPGSSPGWFHPLVDSEPWPKQFKSSEIHKNRDNLCPPEGCYFEVCIKEIILMKTLGKVVKQ